MFNILVIFTKPAKIDFKIVPDTVRTTQTETEIIVCVVIILMSSAQVWNVGVLLYKMQIILSILIKTNKIERSFQMSLEQHKQKLK